MKAFLFLLLMASAQADTHIEDTTDSKRFFCLTSDVETCEVLRMAYIQNQSSNRDLMNRYIEDQIVLQESILRIHERINQAERRLLKLEE